MSNHSFQDNYLKFRDFIFANIKGILKAARIEEEEINKKLQECASIIDLRIYNKLVKLAPNEVKNNPSEESKNPTETTTLLQELFKIVDRKKIITIVADEHANFLKEMLSVFINHLTPATRRNFLVEFDRTARQIFY